MSRTIRRKHYTPRHIVEESYSFIDPRTGVQVWWAGTRRLEGKELAKALLYWHEDKSCWWGACPSKWFRASCEVQHRMRSKAELNRFMRNPDYEPLLDRKALLGYWD